MKRILRNLGVATAAAALAVTTLVGPAAAVDPVSGVRYRGHVILDDHWPIPTTVTFRVSQSGNWVTGMSVGPYPINVCGSGGDPPRQTTSKAAITRGAFTAHVTYRSDTGRLLARATVKGTFLKHRRERGTVRTTIADRPDCGATYSYTTAVQ